VSDQERLNVAAVRRREVDVGDGRVELRPELHLGYVERRDLGQCVRTVDAPGDAVDRIVETAVGLVEVDGGLEPWA
jgi:hypothetical protein